jgi:hypothetical protein
MIVVASAKLSTTPEHRADVVSSPSASAIACSDRDPKTPEKWHIVSKIHESEVAMLHPTQITVGMIEVHDKRKQLEKLAPHRLRDHLALHPIPAVIGHQGRLYITDHHHLGRALWEEGVETTFFVVEADLSELPLESFWAEMRSKHWAHPIDDRGQRQPIETLPKHIKGLIDDPYRSLAGYVRDAGGYEKTPTAFAEFLWADFFRHRVRIGPKRENFERAVDEALTLAHSAAARHLPGFVASAES